MKPEIPKELPPKYYLDNFNSLLSFVEGMYGQLLTRQEQGFIAAFRRLSEDGRCLFLRFANRKGLFFRTDKLQYPEIADIDKTLQELLFYGFCELPAPKHERFAVQVLGTYSKPELCALFKKLNPAIKGIASLKKDELIGQILQDFSWQVLLEVVKESASLIKHNYERELELLKFLFFGYLGGDMSEFVIRDLGMIRFETPDEDKLVARFTSRQEIEDKFWVSLIYEQFRELREQNCPETLYSWYMQCVPRGQQVGALAKPLFDKLTLKLARILERHKQGEWALEVYEHTLQAPARERRARLLQKTGAIQEAIELCHTMQQEPQNADELFFARDFSAKLLKKKGNKSTTQHLKEAQSVQISYDYRFAVEKGVMRHFRDRGQEVLYSENYLWRSLFGLIFWDIIFDQDAPVYHSPLQRAPSDLYLPNFLDSRKQRMQQRIEQLKSKKKLVRHVEKVYDEKWGIGNPLVGWHEDTLPLVRAACKQIPIEPLFEVLLEMARKLKENGRGFPDLFSWTKKGYTFIEVKSPNDSLSAQQLYWLQFFKQCGIKAQVLKVEWV